MSTEIVPDFTPKATPEQYQDFLEGFIHSDFLMEMDVRIEDLRNLLEIPQHLLTGNGDENHDMIRGAIKFARQMKDLFNTLALSAEDHRQTVKLEDSLQEDEHDS